MNRQKKHINEVVRGAQRRRIICRAQRRADSKRPALTKLAASPMAWSSSRRMVISYGVDGMLRSLRRSSIVLTGAKWAAERSCSSGARYEFSPPNAQMLLDAMRRTVQAPAEARGAPQQCTGLGRVTMHSSSYAPVLARTAGALT